MHVDFENNGYFVVREFFDDTTVKLMQQYWDLKWRQINFFRGNNLQDEIDNVTLKKRAKALDDIFHFYAK